MASRSACPAPRSCAQLLVTQLLWIKLITDSVPALAMGVDSPTDDEAGLRMTAEWHKPVSAVLDYFQVERVTLIGMSLGGCLVMRAAALEPRIERVVAFDIFTNGVDITLRQTPALLRGFLKVLLRLRAASVVNWMLARVAPRDTLRVRAGRPVAATSWPAE